LVCNAQNSILNNLKEAPLNGGLEMKDYWGWGSSVIKGNDGILAHSPDGINWKIDKNPQAYTKSVKWNNGKTIQQGQLERVFVLVENGEPTHLFFATMDGPGGFGNSTKSWNMVIPLKH
jgi:hypothetical protein